MKVSLRLVPVVLLLAAGLPASGSEPPVTSPLAIRARAAFLASDALEGRYTGSRGYGIAAEFAASQFAGWGLEPGAGNGTFFQPVTLVKSTIEAPGLAVGRGSRMQPLSAEDFVLAPRPVGEDVAGAFPVVFVGYGMDAPALGHRDWDEVDVRGKTALILSGAPAGLPPEERAHYSSRRLKAELAARHGAAGVLMMRTTEDAERLPWARLQQYARHPSMHWVGADGKIADAFPELRFTGLVSERVVESLFEGSGTTAAEVLAAAARGEARPRALAATVKVDARYARERLTGHNVIAVLPGSDPALAREHVVVSAHLDHMGIGREVDGDAIYNGFYDNALGSSIVMEIAHALSRLPTRPRRSIDFTLVTGEEEGLLGSDYLAQHPTSPGDAVVANVNIDMPLLLGPVADLIALGADHSTLGPLAARAAAAHGFTLSPDPNPEEAFFVRSDQYSFVRAGVPAINIDPGETSADPAVDIKARNAEFRKTHYHRPSDHASLPVDMDALARYTRVNLDVIAAVAASDAPPRWNEADFFGTLYGRTLKAAP